MSTQVKLDPALQSLVERSREHARERGELRDGPSVFPSGALSSVAKAALVDWVASGDYDRTIAEITADDPELATQ